MKATVFASAAWLSYLADATRLGSTSAATNFDRFDFNELTELIADEIDDYMDTGTDFLPELISEQTWQHMEPTTAVAQADSETHSADLASSAASPEAT